MEPRIFGALDIGSTMVRAMIAQTFDGETVYCIGYGESLSEGMRKGAIVNIDKVTRAISSAVESAEQMAGQRIDSMLVGASGEQVRSINSQGVINVARSDQEIVMADVKKVQATARDVVIPLDREIIHVIPQEYAVDNQGGVRNPIGMTGARLEVDTHIVTYASQSAKNMFRALERCDLSLSGLALKSYAASRCVISEDEEEMGVALVDLGAGATDIAVFAGGAIRYTGSIALGMQNVTNDIAIGLRTDVTEAESLKRRHGVAMSAKTSPHEIIEVQAADGREAREIGRAALANIIEARVEEIFSLVMREIKRVKAPDGLAAGVTLIGGGARLAGIVDLAEQTLNLPVKIGRPQGLENLPSQAQSPECAPLVGMILYALEQEMDTVGRRGGMRGFMKKVENWIQEHL